MKADALQITIRFNFQGDSTPAAFHRASQDIQTQYSIIVKTYETYRYINMHTVCAPATILYRRNSIMQHVYHKGLFEKGIFGLFKKKYYLDVMVYADGTLVFQRF